MALTMMASLGIRLDRRCLKVTIIGSSKALAHNMFTFLEAGYIIRLVNAEL